MRDPREYRARPENWRGAPPASPIAQCTEALAQAIDARSLKHGDLPQWRSVIETLPSVHDASLVIDDGVVRVGIDLEFDDATRKSLMQLCPWRKGPFEICGVSIDTEWRSDWKWNRVLPALTSLRGRHVMDIGCGSGYHLWRMREAGAASVLGVEPMLLYQHQFDVLQHYARDPAVQCVPLALEHLPDSLPLMDTVFSMGVLYHARDPHQHLRALHARLRPGGEVLLETLVADDGIDDGTGAQEPDHEIVIEDRYARMRNISVLPSAARVLRWLQEAGFEAVRLTDLSRTSLDEQRRTIWMPFDSLQESLDPDNLSVTIEGLPAPCRAVFAGTRSPD